MVNTGSRIETSKEARKRLKTRIENLGWQKKAKKSDLKKLKEEIQICKEELEKLGDFP